MKWVFVRQRHSDVVVRTLEKKEDLHLDGFRLMDKKERLFGTTAGLVKDGVYDEHGTPISPPHSQQREPI